MTVQTTRGSGGVCKFIESDTWRPVTLSLVLMRVRARGFEWTGNCAKGVVFLDFVDLLIDTERHPMCSWNMDVTMV